MKIGNPAGGPPAERAGSGTGATSGASGPRASTPTDAAVKPAATAAREASSTVAISPAATAMLQAADADVDVQKVAQVRQAIADGTYKVNADAIADKLIANAKDVLAQVQRRRAE